MLAPSYVSYIHTYIHTYPFPLLLTEKKFATFTLFVHINDYIHTYFSSNRQPPTRKHISPVCRPTDTLRKTKRFLSAMRNHTCVPFTFGLGNGRLKGLEDGGAKIRLICLTIAMRDTFEGKRRKLFNCKKNRSPALAWVNKMLGIPSQSHKRHRSHKSINRSTKRKFAQSFGMMRLLAIHIIGT